jgi:sugar/nucleoside kinase (ribokinase family)
MSNKFDVIAIGDTTQDIFLQMDDANVQCSLDGKNCLLCFDYAEKIGVAKKTDVPAVGNAANHAIGIARLGLKAGIYTIVGDDSQGHKALEIFQENGVDSKYVVLDKDRGTNLSVVINVKGERTILVYHERRKYELPALVETDWVYLTSVSGEGVEMLHEQMLEYLNNRPKVKLAFNPGTYQIKLGKEKLLPLLRRTEVLFVNREEAARILEQGTQDVKELLRGFQAIGVKTVVITDGPDGSYVGSGEEVWQAGIFAGPVVERTGAGDGYGSGFLGAIIKGKKVLEAMAWGNANSTSVVQYIGAREGLLTEEAIGKQVEDNLNQAAKRI